MLRARWFSRLESGQRERGQALVELAVMSPAILLILLGALDLGRLFYYQMAVTNAAREAARYASTAPTDAAGIAARAQTEAAPLTIPAGNVATFAPGGLAAGNPILVAVTYQFQAVTPAIDQIWGGGSLTLRGEVNMVIQ